MAMATEKLGYMIGKEGDDDRKDAPLLVSQSRQSLKSTAETMPPKGQD